MMYNIMFWILAAISGFFVLAVVGSALEKLGWTDPDEESGPISPAQFISFIVLAVLFAAGSLWAYSFKEEGAMNEKAKTDHIQEEIQNQAALDEARRIKEEKIAAEREREAKIERCIDMAIHSGYRNGQCANGFITACLAGSRKKLEVLFATDKLLDIVESWNCPNMDTTYADAFDEEYDKLY